MHLREKITIESDCCIGLESIILTGVKIGRGAIVAAGSLVTKDVTPYSIVGGSAKVISMRFMDSEILEHEKLYYKKGEKMKIGILVSMINNFGEKGFYNSQEVGMAKQLEKMGHEVIVYKLIKKGKPTPKDEKDGNLTIYYRNVASLGINGLVDTDLLDTELDKLVFFSDTQLVVPKIYRWCKKNGVEMIPYIGVVESHSTNKYIAWIMNALFIRNVNVFKKTRCLVKTNDVREKLSKYSIPDITVAPVGIDFDLLHKDYHSLSTSEAKKIMKIDKQYKIALLVGRIASDRNPLDCVDIFKRIYQQDSRYRLLIVGKGELEDELKQHLHAEGLDDTYYHIPQIPNSEMWKVYRATDVLLNFSRTEIFGMSILEAMFYETEVHAVKAPGPNDIIKNEENGYLYTDAVAMAEMICNNLGKNFSLKRNAHDSVLKDFSWAKTAELIALDY